MIQRTTAESKAPARALHYATYYIDPDVRPEDGGFLVASKSGDSWGFMTAEELEILKAEARTVLAKHGMAWR